MNTTNQPLVTVLLITFNQEQYIAEATRSVLAQTYTNLEFIFSDDCSTDSTYSVLEHEVQNYTGDARTVLNRTKSNSGITSHINSAVKLARGDLIILAAGDDISLPSRVATIVEKWERIDYSPCSIFSAFQLIDPFGKSLPTEKRVSFSDYPEWISAKAKDRYIFNLCPGCTQAFTPDSYRLFGDLPIGIIQEDICLKLRSSLLGSVGYIREPLVLYRQTSESQTRSKTRSASSRIERRIKYLKSHLRALEDFKHNALIAHNAERLDATAVEWALFEADTRIANISDEISFLDAPFATRLKSVLSFRSRTPSRMKRLLYSFLPNLYGWRTSK